MLVDTSVWVHHLRQGSDELASLLEEGLVEVHPFVLGELALGDIRHRGEFLGLLGSLPSVPMAEHEEVLQLVEDFDLAGSGIGWVDAHLLASALLGGTRLLTADRALGRVASNLGLAPD